jgi:hypothetical protein
VGTAGSVPVLHVGSMIQIRVPGRVAEIPDPLLALMLAVNLGLSERLQYSAPPTFRLKLTRVRVNP